jgi:hypothetical protein
MNLFRQLSLKDKETLLKFPAFISLLAANGDGKLDETEKMSAVKFSHMKTFSGEPFLAEFHLAADKVFETNLDQLDRDLPKETANREAAIKMELLKIETIVLKLGKRYASGIHRSMSSFKEHVSKAHRHVLVDFILPIPIPGLTEN